MRVAHFCNFAPGRCGMYEAARDFVRADRLAGRVAELCDTGGDGREPEPGIYDERSGERTVARAWGEVKDFDMFVVHGRFVSDWMASIDAPIVMAIHGRPAACFRPEQNGTNDNRAFSWICEASRYESVKAMITMWAEHVPYWEQLIPREKLHSTGSPPIDCKMFHPNGPKLDFPEGVLGKRNLLICDSWREDVDCFEAAMGAVCAAEIVPDLRVHFFAVEHKDGKYPACWDRIFRRLKDLDALGIVNGRILEIAQVYRQMDVMLSPHRIAVRTIGESMATGLPVVAELGCRYTPYTAQMQDPESVAQQIKRCLSDLDTDKAAVSAKARMQAVTHFGLKQFGEKLTGIYEKAMCLPLTCETVGEMKESA